MMLSCDVFEYQQATPAKLELSGLEMQVAITGVAVDGLASTKTLQDTEDLQIPRKTDYPFQGSCS
jgi:hypothetical protein